MWPNFTAQNVKKHLPKSCATSKGHMGHIRKNKQSAKIMDEDSQNNLNPPQEAHTQARSGKYVLIGFDYDSNAILAYALNSHNDQDILEAYEKMYNHLSKCSFPPKLNVVDNEASWRLKQAITNTNTKDHSCFNSKFSAHAQLNGDHDFNAVPLVPPGTRVIIFDDLNEHRSWAPHGTSGWYVGPAPEHYCCYTFYIPETKATCITATADFFSVHSDMPKLLSADAATLAANDLIQALNIQHQLPHSNS
eukprot:549884-Ditylum_brightwellii.AAC.1